MSHFPQNPSSRLALAAIAAALLAASPAAAAMDYGHLRARTRAMPYSGTAAPGGADDPSFVETEEMGESQDVLGHEEPIASVAARTESTAATSVGGNVGERMAVVATRKDRFRTGPREGYLAFGPPNALRFSDDPTVGGRPPSPALPEFTVVSDEYVPYLVESPLPEDARNDPSLLSEIVVDLEPHEVVSGKIDVSRREKEEKVEHFDLEEHRSTVLKPADVLIYFESDTSGAGKVNAIIPFQPATPSAETIRSSATLKTE